MMTGDELRRRLLELDRRVRTAEAIHGMIHDGQYKGLVTRLERIGDAITVMPTSVRKKHALMMIIALGHRIAAMAGEAEGGEARDE